MIFKNFANAMLLAVVRALEVNSTMTNFCVDVDYCRKFQFAVLINDVYKLKLRSSKVFQ